jgi:hypothetical protein
MLFSNYCISRVFNEERKEFYFTEFCTFGTFPIDPDLCPLDPAFCPSYPDFSIDSLQNPNQENESKESDLIPLFLTATDIRLLNSKSDQYKLICFTLNETKYQLLVHQSFDFIIDFIPLKIILKRRLKQVLKIKLERMLKQILDRRLKQISDRNTNLN